MQSALPSGAKLIAGFYEAAAAAASWQTVGQDLCRAVEAEASVLWRDGGDGKPDVLAAVNWPADTIQMIPGGPSGPTGRVLGAVQPLEGGGGRAGIGIMRGPGLAAFGAGERAVLDGAVPHLAAALRLERMLRESRVESAARAAALDQFSHGAIIASADGRVSYANSAAARLATHGGLVLEYGQITCAEPGEARRLATLIAQACAGREGGALRITRPSPLPILAGNVTPLSPDDRIEAGLTQPMPLAMITIRDLSATSDADPVQLKALFGLTAAEAAILPQLLEGDSISMIAQSRGASVATVRTQAARVLAKTGAVNLRALATMIAALGCA